MNSVNKTLYIPLYGKSYVSQKGVFLHDEKAEEIWAAEGFMLRGKSKSKWLAYYLGIRAAVFDEWARRQMSNAQDAVVIHIGCGLGSRVLRVGTMGHKWYDVDLPQVIGERKRYFEESNDYQMLPGDASDGNWLKHIPETGHAIVLMEGISMYLSLEQMRALTAALINHFQRITLLVDCYSVMAARLSKYKNPINDMGVTEVYGMDEPTVLQQGEFTFAGEHTMTPPKYIEELRGMEKFVFEKLYAGNFAKRLYRLYEFSKQ